MIYINSFIIVGLISMLGELLLDNTKLTPGHITSLFVCFGAILSFFDIYDYLVTFSKIGSSIPITSFGNMLYLAAYEGLKTKGILGLFSNILVTTSAGISSSVIFGFLVSVFFKAKD